MRLRVSSADNKRWKMKDQEVLPDHEKTESPTRYGCEKPKMILEYTRQDISIGNSQMFITLEKVLFKSHLKYCSR